MKIGEILVSKGYITHDNLDEVLKIQQEQLPYNVRFGEICISHGFCSEAEIINALSEQLDLYTLDLFVDEKLGEVDNIQHDLVLLHTVWIVSILLHINLWQRKS